MSIWDPPDDWRAKPTPFDALPAFGNEAEDAVFRPTPLNC